MGKRHQQSRAEREAALAGLPYSTLKKRVAQLEQSDKRAESRVYYKVYLAENCLKHSRKRRALELLDEVLAKMLVIHFENAAFSPARIDSMSPSQVALMEGVFRSTLNGAVPYMDVPDIELFG